MTDQPAPSRGGFVFYRCRAPACGLRFPVLQLAAIARCPRCGAGIEQVAVVPAAPAESHDLTPRRLLAQRVDVLVDNLRSVYNVGSIFRTADGAGLHHLYLCGISPTPQHSKLAKTALGAERAVAWSYHADALPVLQLEQARGVQVWALEAQADAKLLPASLDAMIASARRGIVLVVGNENAGIDPALLAHADEIVRLPMYGVKHSLNVATAFAAAAYLIAGAMIRIHGSDLRNADGRE